MGVTRRNDGPHDNRQWRARSSRCAREQARLHGHASYADYALSTPCGHAGAVNELLQQVWGRRWRAPRPSAKLAGGGRLAHETLQIEAWDWRYYAEKESAPARYDVDERAVNRTLRWSAMVEAVFDCAERLFAFVSWHTDMKAYHARREAL